jgi:hypothetical protein
MRVYRVAVTELVGIHWCGVQGEEPLRLLSSQHKEFLCNMGKLCEFPVLRLHWLQKSSGGPGATIYHMTALAVFVTQNTSWYFVEIENLCLYL